MRRKADWILADWLISFASPITLLNLNCPSLAFDVFPKGPANHPRFYRSDLPVDPGRQLGRGLRSWRRVIEKLGNRGDKLRWRERLNEKNALWDTV